MWTHDTRSNSNELDVSAFVEQLVDHDLPRVALQEAVAERLTALDPALTQDLLTSRFPGLTALYPELESDISPFIASLRDVKNLRSVGEEFYLLCERQAKVVAEERILRVLRPTRTHPLEVSSLLYNGDIALDDYYMPRLVFDLLEPSNSGELYELLSAATILDEIKGLGSFRHITLNIDPLFLSRTTYQRGLDYLIANAQQEGDDVSRLVLEVTERGVLSDAGYRFLLHLYEKYGVAFALDDVAHVNLQHGSFSRLAASLEEDHVWARQALQALRYVKVDGATVELALHAKKYEQFFTLLDPVLRLCCEYPEAPWILVLEFIRNPEDAVLVRELLQGSEVYRGNVFHNRIAVQGRDISREHFCEEYRQMFQG